MHPRFPIKGTPIWWETLFWIWCNVERVIIDTFKCYKAEGKQFHSENSKWIWPFSKCFSEHLFSISLEWEVTLLFDFFSRLREISNVFNNVLFEGKSIFRIFSKHFPNGLWNTSFGKKIMSEGTPSLPSLVDRGRSLLKAIMIVRVISVKFILLTIMGTLTCLRILSIETTLYWKLRVH